MSERLSALLRGARVWILAGVLLAAADAQAETWRMASKQPPDSPEGIVFQKFADLVGTYSDGKLDVQVYPSEQLGQAEAVLEQLSAGTVQVYAEDADYLAKWVPDISYLASPFVFADRDHWLRFIKSDLARNWLQQARDASGITTIGEIGCMVRGPYRVLVSKKPVGSLDDLQGLKLRMYDDELAVAAWDHLGADVRVIGWSDVYQSIQSGVVEAVTSPVALVESMKFHEVAPHIIRTSEYFQSTALLVNADAYGQLAPDLRTAVDRAYTDACTESQEIMGRFAEESLGRMQARGVTFEEIDTGPFVARMRDFYLARAADGSLPKGFFEAVEATR